MKKTRFFLMTQIIFTIFSFTLYGAGNQKSSRPIVRDIIATGTANATINISWSIPKNPSPKINSLLLYRSTRPIDSYYDLSGLTPLVTLFADTSFYADIVDNYIDYYYAVVAVTTAGVYDIVIPSINSTVSGTHLKMPSPNEHIQSTASAKEKIYSSENMRETPLPYLDLIENQNKKPIKMSDKARIEATRLGKTKKLAQKPLAPYIFEDDLISPDGGDAFILFEILRTAFIQKKYKESAEQLEHLIGTNCVEAVKNRAIFYLAESYYYSGDYKTAATTFLKIYDAYPSISKKWIDSSLDYFEISK